MQEKLEQFHERMLPYITRYPGVLNAVYIFVSKMNEGNRMDRHEIEQAMSMSHIYIPAKDQSHVISEMQRTQNKIIN